MTNKMLQFSIMNDTMNDIVNDKKGHNIVSDRFVHEPDGSHRFFTRTCQGVSVINNTDIHD